MNLFYRLMINGLSNNLDIKLKNAVRTLEEYHKFNGPEHSKFDNDRVLQFSDDRFIKTQKDNKVIHDIFFENLHIHISESETEKIYSIRIKKADESWQIRQNEGVNDYSHLNNDTYEVYVWYEVPVLDITTSIGYLYKNGNWDKYFYNAITRFLNSVNNMTDNNKFNEAYKKDFNKEVDK